MEVTPDHPIYVDGRGWVEAEDVVLGDRLRRRDGEWASVLAVERVARSDTQSLILKESVSRTLL